MSQKPRQPFVPPLLAIGFGILAVSTASIFIRYAQTYVPSLVIAAYRLSIASIVLIPFVIPKKRELNSLNRSQLSLLVLSGIFLAVHFGTWITSLAYTSVASSVVLVSTTPLFVALFAPFLLKEPLSRLAAGGMLLALLGSAIVGLSDTCTMQSFRLQCPPLFEFMRGEAFIGDLLAIGGAVAAAGYVIIGRRSRERLSLVSYVFVVYGTASLALIFVVIASRLPLSGYPANAYLWFVLLALIPQLMGHSTFNWALGYLSAAFVSITLLGEPIGTTVLAYFLLDERPTLLKIIGAILIFAGIIVASQAERDPSRLN